MATQSKLPRCPYFKIVDAYVVVPTELEPKLSAIDFCLLVLLAAVEKKLGFKPYPGTLNISLIGKDEILKRALVEKAADIVIEGFSDEKRAYGGARCIKALLDGEEVVIIFIERTHYSRDVVEVISPLCLREKLGLKDGDKVVLRVKLTPTSLA